MTDSSTSFHKILLATDFSDAAVMPTESAAKIAQRCEAKLTIAHVVPDAATTLAVSAYDAGAVWTPTLEDMDRLQKDLCDGAEERLRRLASQLHNGFDIETSVLIGAPYVSIVETVRQNGFDLVVAGTRGMSAIKRIFVGSTATRLARACPAPVWIARREWPDHAPTILATVDFSPVSEQVVSVSASLAAALGAQLHVLHVYDNAEFYASPTLSEKTRGEFGRYRRRARSKAFARLEHLLDSQSVDHTSATFRVAQGTPYQAIKSVARQLDASLVVMGSVGRRGVSALLIGNTAEKILHALDRSLLVIKPVEAVATADEASERYSADEAEPVYQR